MEAFLNSNTEFEDDDEDEDQDQDDSEDDEEEKGGWKIYVIDCVVKLQRAAKICSYEKEIDAIVGFGQNYYTEFGPKFKDRLKNLPTILERKHHLTSKEHREDGNDLNEEEPDSHEKILKKYTLALFVAENNLDRAYAHANRGVVLIRMNRYEMALHECNQAKKYEYPKKLKLLYRMADCCIQMKNANCLRNIINEIIKHGSEAGIFNGIHFKIKMKQLTDEENLIKMNHLGMDTIKTLTKTDCIIDDDDEQSIVHHKETEVIQNKTVGRHVIATENIKEYDRILTEKPFAMDRILGWQIRELKRCHRCTSTEHLLVPCTNCTAVGYCTEHCLLEHIKIHQFQCPGYKKLMWRDMGISFFGLNVFLNGYEELFEKIKHLRNIKPTELYDYILKISETEFDHFNYGNVLRLLTNFDKKNIFDSMLYVMTSVYLTIYLNTETNFFCNMPAYCYDVMEKKRDWKIVISALILRNILQCVTGGHTIDNPAYVNRNNVKANYDIFMGKPTLGLLHQYCYFKPEFTALYPRISLLNHSCDSNITNMFISNQLTIIALRTINKFEEILNCYGHQYTTENTEERTTSLSAQYHFICHCEKCIIEEEKNQIYYCQTENCDGIIKNAYLFDWNEHQEVLSHACYMICPKCSKQFNMDVVINLVRWMNFISDQCYRGYSDHQLCSKSVRECFDLFKSSIQNSMGNNNYSYGQAVNCVLTLLSEILSLHFYDLLTVESLLKIAYDFYDHSRKRYGNGSAQVIYATALLFDIGAIGMHAAQQKRVPFLFKYDKKHLSQLFTIMPTNMSSVIQQYMKDYMHYI